jgi:creatinine amidohydrolase
MRYEELNWMDVENYLKTDDRLMIVIGACEQHGYLSLLTDIKIPLAMADAASARTNVLIAPPLNFGLSPYFAKYPGTISLRASTFLAVIEDIVRWVYGQGFRKLLFVNGHGGNTPAMGVLNELVNELPDLKVDWYSWWVADSVKKVAADSGLIPNHANWLEAFTFCRVADLPEGVKPATPAPRAILNANETKALYNDGVFGGSPYKADEAVMQKIFEAAVGDVIAKLQFTG